MTTITLSPDVPMSAVTKIRAYLDSEAANNPAWNGVDFRIEIGEFTCVDTHGVEACILLRGIFDIIKGE